MDHSGSRTYFFIADSAEQRVRWMRALEVCCAIGNCARACAADLRAQFAVHAERRAMMTADGEWLGEDADVRESSL